MTTPFLEGEHLKIEYSITFVKKLQTKTLTCQDIPIIQRSMKRLFLAAVFSISSQLFGEALVVPLHHTPFNDNIQLRLKVKHPIHRGDPLIVQYRSFPLGVQTFSESLQGMRRNPNGSTIVVIFNAKDRISITDRDEVPMIEKKAYFEKELSKRLPRKLKVDFQKGKVMVSIIALNAFNESIKMPGAMAVEVLDYENPPVPNKTFSEKLKMPYIHYIQPLGKFKYKEPILLDFYLVNTEIAPAGNKVELYVDGRLITRLSRWTPYQLQNLEPGFHKIKLVLVSPDNTPLPLPFTPQEAIIEVKE